MSSSARYQRAGSDRNHKSKSPHGNKQPVNQSVSAKPYRFGIKIKRPYTDSMAGEALQIEANRATRHVGETNKELKMPLPRVPAVLAYLRWLDKMDAWHKTTTSMHETSARIRDTQDLYSWNGNFGSPLVLPKIRKHPKPEKYHSQQLEKTIYDQKLREPSGREMKPDYVEAIRRKQLERRIQAAHSYAAAKASSSAPPMRKSTSERSSCSDRMERSGKEGKHTKFYHHAMNGFKYWPSEIYNQPVHHTKYSFGNQFNPGRAGVITDRIYTRPRTNKHYWTEFQLHQNPIGSGNSVTGKVLSN